MKKYLIISLFILLIGIVSATINCPVSSHPNLPKTYYGTVFYNNTPLTGNYEIRAKIGGYVVSYDDVSNGKYEIDIGCSGITGEVIFLINNVQASPKGNYYGGWPESVNLNLTVNSIPGSLTCGVDKDGKPSNAIDFGEECDGDNLAGRNVNDCGTDWEGTISCSSNCLIDYSNCTFVGKYCGDGTCNNGETCSTCSQDCGTCPSNNPSSNGGGSPGGGGGTSSNTIYLNPPEENNDNGDTNKYEEISENKNKSEDDDKKKSSLTGLAIVNFAKSKTGIGIGVFIILLGIGVIGIKYKLHKPLGKWIKKS